MLRLNGVGRFDVAIKALQGVGRFNLSKIDTKLHELTTHYQHQNREAEKYALKYATDPGSSYSLRLTYEKGTPQLTFCNLLST